MQKLTDTALQAAIKQTTGHRDINDPACPGLQLRVSPRARTWYFRYTWRDARVRATLGAYPAIGLADARGIALRARDHLDRGIDPRTAGLSPTGAAGTVAPSTAGAPAKPFSIEALADEFMRIYIEPRRKHPETVRRMLDKDVLTEWAGRDARTITPRQVIELLDGIVARDSPVMANHVARLLGQMFKFAIHRTLVEDSPVKLLMLPGGKEVSRSRCLTDAELKALIVNRDKVFKSPAVRNSVMILLLTLQRRGELAASKWSHIDLDKKVWHIPAENSKTEAASDVPLSTWAVDEFKALKRLAGRSPWVFPDATGKAPADPKLITRSVARCQKRLKDLGVAKFTGHDLRRTGRTGLSKLKITPHIAERCLNHASGSVIERTYDVHDYLDEKRDALDKWAAHLRSLVTVAP